MTIGEKIRQLREEHSMTQSDVAKKVGVAIQTIFKYERNIVTNIPSETVEKLAILFGVSPAYLMGWVDEQTEKKNSSIADIILHLQYDDNFFNFINTLNTLKATNQLSALQQEMITLITKMSDDQLKGLLVFIKSTLEKETETTEE